ncbi:MAG: PAS domain-containing protein [Candidatus Rokubacteria bacterium]|nr:PAS domain-containing protein [Candidatus Rokubacteria bacterium]
MGRDLTILDGVGDALYAIDARGRLRDLNASAEARLRRDGRDPARLIGTVVWEQLSPPPLPAACRRVMAGRRPLTRDDYDEAVGGWIESRICPTPDGGIAVVQRDITERKRVEEQGRRARAYLADAQRLSRTGSWAFTPATGEVVWSREHFIIFGLDPDGPVPTFASILERIHPDDRSRLEHAFMDAMAARGDFAAEIRVVRPDGAVRHVASLARPAFDDAGTLSEYVGTIIDVTERREADAALHHAQAELAHVARVATMGELAASLAHELGQPLAAIVANGGAALGFLGRSSPDVGKAIDAVRGMIEDAERAGDTIAATRALFRKSTAVKQVVDVNTMLRAALACVAPELRRHAVAVREELADALPSVRAVAVQVQQVVVNLVINASEAMAAVTERRRELVVRSLPDELEGRPAVRVEIEDSGIGLGPDDVRRVFDAFYTTKTEGLGMGLSISRSIVEAHEGRIWATTRRPEGATLRFVIPAADVAGA